MASLGSKAVSEISDTTLVSSWSILFKFLQDEFTFYQKSSNKLAEIETESIQCIFTSPPYALGIREYSNNVEIGSEKTVEEYSENLSNHLVSCYRVLSQKGSFYLSLGDVYKDG